MHLGMHQEFRQRLEQSQRLVMTPAMVQAIRLLQLNAMAPYRLTRPVRRAN